MIMKRFHFSVLFLRSICFISFCLFLNVALISSRPLSSSCFFPLQSSIKIESPSPNLDINIRTRFLHLAETLAKRGNFVHRRQGESGSMAFFWSHFTVLKSRSCINQQRQQRKQQGRNLYASGCGQVGQDYSWVENDWELDITIPLEKMLYEIS